MQPIREETQTAPPSTPPVESNEQSSVSDFEALALRGAPECARCGAKDGDYAFDRTTKRLICTDTSWQHLHLQHRKARERMLIALGGAFGVTEMPEMRTMVVACERNLWYNANSLAEYLDQSTLQRRLQNFASNMQRHGHEGL